ncbi:hypothetical protein DPEC_G00195900 [Dallia pectoralis]|uniref:Uncharacterized protein n=1 Tax=Dallia pectoralis TaxID=75939 RepID=A0ACC2G7I5_DALPE|nr:hypothetical protein DPEC_G00195900 [Dallia pectoralis]
MELNNLLEAHNLYLGCDLCCKPESEITYTLNNIQEHDCTGAVLLARQKQGTVKWRLVSHPPLFPNPQRYSKCTHYTEELGCTQHKRGCTFARSTEEAAVWTFLKQTESHCFELASWLRKERSPPLEKSLSLKGNIERQFPGMFMELCETCFHLNPQFISNRDNSKCNSRHKHSWKATLVLRQQKTPLYLEVRPLPNLPVTKTGPWRFCRYLETGEQCRNGAHRCWFAHNKAEMAVWTAEDQGLVRSELLANVRRRRRSSVDPPLRIFGCKVCIVSFPSWGGFQNHLNTMDHINRTNDFNNVTKAEWKCREPPQTNKAYKLCERASTCEFGSNCVDAHSAAELQEWRARDRTQRKTLIAAEEQGLLSYQNNLWREYRESGNKEEIISDTVSGVKVNSDKDLIISCSNENVPLRWKLNIQSERLLAHVALLKQEPGASFSLEGNIPEPCTYSKGEHFCSSDMTYDITVSFKSIQPGLYEQWLVLDFDMRPVLRQKLKVTVGQQSSLNPEEPPEDLGIISQNLERWHQWNRVIIPCLDKTEAEEELLNEYKPPQISFQYEPLNVDSTPMNRENYKDRMHSFLYSEELAEHKVVSRLNVRGTITLSATLDNVDFGMKIAPPGGLFCAISVPYTLTPNTPEGWMLRRNVQSALIAPVSSDDENTKVYEAIILRDATSENTMHLQLSKRCCSDLQLQESETREIEVQFQLNRLMFCEMHKAIDLLPNTERVLPDFRNCTIPVNNILIPTINAKQQRAINFIVGESDWRKSVAPLLIYGPFGTGKTFTLFTAARELIQQSDTRILICTHTNSSADLYVKHHFHPYIISGHHKMKLLRIKENKQGVPVNATDEITRQYCLLSEDGQFFLPPDKTALDGHRVVIATTAMARQFYGLKLPVGYFTHILIDEASQMLECEALMPLGLAGPFTQVVLAGDHMQMGPKLFSVDDRQRSNHTLLNRLFHYYQGQESRTALRSRIIFNENYRSTKEIVDFVSINFYVGKSDVIKAVGDVPGHPESHALRFHHVRGEAHLEKTSMSWFNMEEAACVVTIVQNLLRDWPLVWGILDQSSICVLSEGYQVTTIRKELRKIRLGRVTVENIANVQGKQFRVIVLTAVQTRNSLDSSDSPCVELFNDARVLNTAMTRAQSQVVAVGDAAALCYFGTSSRIWRNYIDHCIGNHSATLTEEDLMQEIQEISRMVQRDKEDSDSESTVSEIPDVDDPILKELLDEGQDVRITVTAEGLLGITRGEAIVNPLDGFQMTNRDIAPRPASQRDLGIYKRCHLVMERYDLGYAIPIEEPSLRISIKGRKNIGRSFPGDQVSVEILDSKCQPPSGKVLDVVKASNSKLFVCTIDIHDLQVMTPINIRISKIYTPFWKDKPNYVAVRKIDDLRIEKFVKINEESRRNNIFVVKVLMWREKFRLPLGVVVKVLPKVTSLETGLDVLDIEYQLARDPPVENDEKILKELDTDTQSRMDYQELTTFTIDPAHSKDLDDAISVRDLGSRYEIGVHIADVASLVTKGSQLDRVAQQNGTSFYPPENEPVYMFPVCLSTNHFSLLPGRKRNAISLMLEIDKETDRIERRTFQLSVIKSDRKFSYEEAENIIQNSADSNGQYDRLEGCLIKAFHFSEVHRKDRKLEDWCYKSPDDDVTVGKRRSHAMVEELMVMYNHAVTELLLKDAKTVGCTPVRCQDKPDTQKLRQLKEKYGSWIPLTIHFGHCVNQPVDIDDNQRTLETEAEKEKHPGGVVQTPETFSLLTSIWRSIKSAHSQQDVHRIVDLIATDDIHPQLLPLILEFRKTIHRAHVLCSNSTYLSKVGHHDLQLDSYTWASSPIRRYIDVIVQRLVHLVLDGKTVNYNSVEIELSCLSFSERTDKQKVYERTSLCLRLASLLNNQNARKLAFVIEASRVGKGLQVYFPLARNSMPDAIPIMYRDLQLTDLPEYDEHDNRMVLKWKRRVYSLTNEHVHDELQHQGRNPFVISVPVDMWERTVSALKQDDWAGVFKSLHDISSHVDRRQPLGSKRLHHAKTPGANQNPEHYVEMQLKVKPGETLEVQLGSDTQRGLLVPVVQMLIVRNKFEICLQHSKDPTQCFSKYATHSSKQTYATYMEYQKIWKPLCEMESASNAVSENESIVLEDVPLTWEPAQKDRQLRGFFRLPLEKMKQWAIEFGLRHSFLCIRMRYLPEAESQRNDDCEHGDFNDIPALIWVAHGITTQVTDEEEAKILSYVQIDFRINHLSFAKIPTRVFRKDTRFTVELISKLLPDVRKEAAITNLTQANQLVKNIALGWRTNFAPVQKKQTIARFEIEGHTSVKFPDLNNSQTKAIREALDNQFTLIQGPPGTGKTVVGVHIVYWFFQQNLNVPTRLRQRAEDGSLKKRSILYCGPSNKSVDVVAGQLLKLREVLKPLRVYSEQMEMLEFPYPGSILRLSRRSVRDERTNRELRPITLHHLIRTPDNQFSREIIYFDQRIQMEEELTDEEIIRYKSILSKARQHELKRHDVILCTCTAAANPNFSKWLDLKQIIVDECAMATEPEVFIPLVTHKPEQIVLLGDHKQLQPITSSDLAARLGMRKSLFERYMEKALMLDTQYRMHERISEFPSMEFYKGMLKTGVSRKPSVLLAQPKHPTPILFGHVDGKETSLVVNTDRGNENSKANVAEAREAVRIASLLIGQARVAQSDIAILTPYNAQVAEVNESLSRKGMPNVTVCTITKSQGSEWRYVILSTVRSCPKSDIDPEPTKAWLTRKLGFIIDPNQVNVGITRAQEGLCIIGNRDLLLCSSLWRKLLSHYQQYGCVLDSAADIQVQNTRR